jgi:hypothetical protein
MRSWSQLTESTYRLEYVAAKCSDNGCGRVGCFENSIALQTVPGPNSYFRRKSLEFRYGQYSFIKFEAPSRPTWVSQRCPVPHDFGDVGGTAATVSARDE